MSAGPFAYNSEMPNWANKARGSKLIGFSQGAITELDVTLSRIRCCLSIDAKWQLQAWASGSHPQSTDVFKKF